MSETAPKGLTELLERTGLAAPEQVRRMGRRVRRLARDLPRFECVWVDALVQARILTPFQAAEIHAGRGESLRVGPYVLCGRLRWPSYVTSYRARHLDSGKIVRLAVIDDPSEPDALLAQLQTLVERSRDLASDRLAPVRDVGIDENNGRRIWAAADWVDGRTASEWMVHNGRFPPTAAMYIAQSIMPALRELEKAGLCHSDLSASAITLTPSGDVVLEQPGLRAVVRAEEGYAHADLQPEAYDEIAPERITRGTPPTTASDVYACGCVWWRLLCGRPPFRGGDAVAKLRAIQTAHTPDVRRLAPDVPDRLATAVSQCIRRDPAARPPSMADLSELVGPPTRLGRKTLVGCLTNPQRVFARTAPSSQRRKRTRRTKAPRVATVAALVCIGVAAALWGPAWKDEAVAWYTGPTKATEPESHDPTGREGNEPKPHEPSPTEPAATRPETDPAETKPIRDPNVAQAAHVVPQTPTPPIEDPAAWKRDLILEHGKPLHLDSLAVRDGQRVCGRRGTRPRVHVPADGLIVDADRVCFENIDFVWAAEQPSGGAIVQLRASQAEFRRCSFRVERSSGVAAIWWRHPEATSAAMLLPAGRLRMKDCVLHRVVAGVACHRRGAVAMELRNVLHLGNGPVVQFERFPSEEEPTRITLAQLTLRGRGGGESLLHFDAPPAGNAPGTLSIEASGCVFATDPLISFAAAPASISPEHSAERLLRHVRWTGQGSLVTPETAIAAADRSLAGGATSGDFEPLDDTAVAIEGLVRSKVTFAGERTDNPVDSKVTDWQAPLRSTNPPGSDPMALPR